MRLPTAPSCLLGKTVAALRPWLALVEEDNYSGGACTDISKCQDWFRYSFWLIWPQRPAGGCINFSGSSALYADEMHKRPPSFTYARVTEPPSFYRFALLTKWRAPGAPCAVPPPPRGVIGVWGNVVGAKFEMPSRFPLLLRAGGRSPSLSSPGEFS